MPAVLAAITLLRREGNEPARDFELRFGPIEETPGAAAYIAAASVNELLDIVLALSAIADAPLDD